MPSVTVVRPAAGALSPALFGFEARQRDATDLIRARATDLDREAALTALARTPPAERPELYGDGRAGERVVAALSSRSA